MQETIHYKIVISRKRDRLGSLLDLYTADLLETAEADKESMCWGYGLKLVI